MVPLRATLHKGPDINCGFILQRIKKNKPSSLVAVYSRDRPWTFSTPEKLSMHWLPASWEGRSYLMDEIGLMQKAYTDDYQSSSGTLPLLQDTLKPGTSRLATTPSTCLSIYDQTPSYLQLADDQKDSWIGWCRYMIEKCDGGEKEKSYTIDLPVKRHGYTITNPEKKRQSTAWCNENEPTRTKRRRAQSTHNQMVATFLYMFGHIATLVLEDQKAVNSECDKWCPSSIIGLV
ncbi:hypothetical protein EVAR_92295_1 [Eumeta japonica]|uniref:Mariner Mos1 transposase n=1 Tax=Eumeta variegata TaxID=151549 RepID=A0A4C1TMI3_EUMVA|nr:hypothetical protein EVAR_92295_1 [Eumeta japonica]